MFFIESKGLYFFCFFGLTICFCILPFAFGKNEILEDEDLLVDLGTLGRVRGSTIDTVHGRKIITFLGIPYGKAPIEEKRFLPAEAITQLHPDNEVFEAFYPGKSCIQGNSLTDPVINQSEDCLSLSVYTPQILKDGDQKLLPVIFFIHGGAFISGSGIIYNGARLLDKDVILVNINYRLGVLGFFSHFNEDIPGNAGLYDTVLALKWVRDNIREFGGDPNLVTIAGQSAGSCAVTHLMTSPLAQGLFHRAIALSGTSINVWGTEADTTESNLRIAELSECDITGNGTELPDYDEISKCMRDTEARILVNSLGQYQREQQKMGFTGFDSAIPIIQSEAETGGIERFLTRDPLEILKEGNQSNVPLMIGATRHDGSFVLNLMYNNFLKENDLEFNSTFLKVDLMPTLLKTLGMNTEGIVGFVESMASAYLGDSKNSGELKLMMPYLIDFCSIFFFKAGIYRFAELHSKIQKNTFVYSFDFKGSQSLHGIMESMIYKQIPRYVPGGVTHADDLFYLFYLPFPFEKEEEQIFSDKMVEYWANFATTGDPNKSSNEDDDNEDDTRLSLLDQVIWPEFSELEPKFAILDSETKIGSDYSQHWHGLSFELFAEYNELLVFSEGLGLVEGIMGQTIVSKRPYKQFLGIPYAKDYTGTNRYKPPKPFGVVAGDNQIFEAKSFSARCNQITPGEGEENCLTINIFTPEKKKTADQKLLPVILYFHGGNFFAGSGESLTGVRLLEEDVVLVTCNYRLGTLGFFDLRIDDAPGNQALYDSILALRWIQKHIEAFGGDPNLVTISGLSAGSAFVTHLLLSPAANGLIHRVLGNSGTSLAAWATSELPLRAHLSVAEKCGCVEEDILSKMKNRTLVYETEFNNEELDTVLTCMKSSAVTLPLLSTSIYEYMAEERIEGRIGIDAFNPVVQSQRLTLDEIVLVKSPLEILEKSEQNPVPLLISCTRHDGSLYAAELHDFYLAPNGYHQNEDFLKNEFVSSTLKAFDADHLDANEISEIYFGEAKNTGNWSQMRAGAIDLLSVLAFKEPTHKMAQYHSRKYPTYMYSFDYQGQYGSFQPGPSGIPGGVAHGDDTDYLIRREPFERQEDQKISEQLVKYWVNFAYYGNPNGNPEEDYISNLPYWPEFKEGDEQFAIINSETTIEKDFPKFWPNAALELFDPDDLPTPMPTTISTTTTTQLPTTTTQLPTTTTEISSTTDDSTTSPPTITTTRTTSTTTPRPTTTTTCSSEDDDDLKIQRNIFLALFIVFAVISIILLVSFYLYCKKSKKSKDRQILKERENSS